MTAYEPSLLNALKIGQKIHFITTCMSWSGCPFNTEQATELLHYIKRYMGKLEVSLVKHLPTITIPDGELPPVPSRKLKNSGTNGLEPSAHALTWANAYQVKLVHRKDGEYLIIKPDGKTHPKTLAELEPHTYPISGGTRAFNLYSVNDMKVLKKLLMEEYGWQPTMWATVTKGKTKVKSTPKFQENGNTCPNLEKVGERISFIRMVITWAKLKSRKGILLSKTEDSGYLADQRVINHHRITAGMAGLAHTRRWRHTGVVNVPSHGKLLGDQFRSLFHAKKGQRFVTYDIASGEDYIKAHFATPYDNGEYGKRIQTEGYEGHQEAGDLWFPELPPEKRRRRAKTGRYALQYQCGAETLAKALDCNLTDAKKHHKSYWALNYGWRCAIEHWETEWRRSSNKTLYNPVTGMTLQTRKMHTLGSTQAQHTLAFAMDYSLCLMFDWLGQLHWLDGKPYFKYKGGYAYLCLYQHDEASWIASKGIAEEILSLGKRSVTTASHQLQLAITLKATGKIGQNWSQTH